MTATFHAALKIHQYLVRHHLDDYGLVGPDPGVRFNYRMGRFVKSYLPVVKWNDHYYYLQAQAYWTLANWLLFARTGTGTYRELALGCSDRMLAKQRADGAWDYPNPEWKGRVATNEGTWAALGLLESYRFSSDSAWLQGALRWHRFLMEVTGFQRVGDELAVNYFAGREGGRVPNNSITVLRMFAELAAITGDDTYWRPCPGLLTFIRRVQTEWGEFPYVVASRTLEATRPHFQCYQYNAFECLNLMRYHDVTGDATLVPTIARQLRFLAQGISESGYARYQCGHQRRRVTYHTAACGAAFSRAHQFGIDGFAELADRTFTYVLGRQKADGAVIHSQRDYGVLTDRRSYPRYLAMMLYHLLYATAARGKPRGEASPKALRGETPHHVGRKDRNLVRSDSSGGSDE